VKVSGKNETEIAQARLMPDQWYEAYSMDAEEKISKAGNEMLVMTVIIRLSGSDRKLIDYMTASAEYRLLSLAEATGNRAKYDAGELNSVDVRAKHFRVKTAMQKDRTGVYGDKIVIAEYARSTAAPAAVETPAPSTSTDVDDDTIPF
jgi:hypothetical protein